MNKHQFRNFAAAVIRELRPDAQFRLPPDQDEVLWCGDVQLGLQNLYAVYIRDNLSESELKQTMLEHFSRILKETDRQHLTHDQSWESIKLKIRPQLIPVEYDTPEIPLALESFGGGVVIGFVIDMDSSYTYVRKEDLSAWNISLSVLKEQGIMNLESASSGMKIHFYPGPDKWIGVEMNDGYDAARILLPGLHKIAADKLGEPFLAGIPNRDFLIMWSKDCSDKFQAFVLQKLQEDFDNQPYSLTPKVLNVTRNNIVVNE